MVGYRIPEVNLFRLRLGFWNCSPLIRVRVRFCACFQDALRALPVAAAAAAASSWGFLQLHRKGFCRRLCRGGVWSIHQPTSFGLLVWVFVFLALFLVSYALDFCCVFFRRGIRSRLCWLLQIVGRRIGSTRVVSEVSGFNLLSF